MNEIQNQIDEILEKYTYQLKDKVDEIAQDAAKDTKEYLRNTSPKSNGAGKHYANGWDVQVKRQPLVGITCTVYNKTKPQLTHLLERGHQVRNQYGTYGRVPGDNHIQNAEERGVENFYNRLVKEL